MPRALLERAARFWRTGQNAFGVVSWKSYEATRGQAIQREDEVTAAIEAQDFLRAADVIEFGLLPELT